MYFNRQVDKEIIPPYYKIYHKGRRLSLMKKLKQYVDVFIQALLLGAGVSIGAVIVVAVSNIM
jgi:hypothetical protein